MKRFGVLLLLVLLTITGCGGGGGGSSTTSTPQAIVPAAKFTTAELYGNTLYSTDSPTTNLFRVITAITFNADGTVQKAINMTTNSTSSASKILNGTFTIDANGVITLNFPSLTPEQLWKTSTIDAFNSCLVASNTSSVISRWFYDQSIGGDQAVAFANGQTIPALGTTRNNGYTLQSGESRPTTLAPSMITGKTFYWAQKNVSYGTINFPVNSDQSPASGTYAVFSPIAASNAASWVAAQFATAVMPIIVTYGQTVATANIVATAPSYYVVSWVVANQAGTNYVRWYFGSTAASAATAYAGNIPTTTTNSSFTTADLSGKTMFWVGGTHYQEVIFNTNGTYSQSDSVVTGTPGNIVVGGYWNVSNGIINLTNNYGTTSYTFSSDFNTSSLKYWRVIRSNGNINAFCYDQNYTNALAQAMALAIVGGPL
jgi:hypothetical protein